MIFACRGAPRYDGLNLHRSSYELAVCDPAQPLDSRQIDAIPRLSRNAASASGVTANIGLLPLDHTRGQILLHGQCRNTTDHHKDGKTNGSDLTDRLKPA